MAELSEDWHVRSFGVDAKECIRYREGAKNIQGPHVIRVEARAFREWTEIEKRTPLYGETKRILIPICVFLLGLLLLVIGLQFVSKADRFLLVPVGIVAILFVSVAIYVTMKRHDEKALVAEWLSKEHWLARQSIANKSLKGHLRVEEIGMPERFAKRGVNRVILPIGVYSSRQYEKFLQRQQE